MFPKPYKQKSNNTLKNSEKKSLAQRVQNEFPSITEEKLKELVHIKSTTSCMKLILHSGEIVGVYVVDGVPMLIELESGLVPTVCALWKVPDLVPTITMHTLVLGKIQGGAPLYLPGVETPAGGVGFPQFRRGEVIAAQTQDNASAVAVGRACMSSGDMLLKAAGVCLDILHWYGDLLCKEQKFLKIERPRAGRAPAGGDVADTLAQNVQQLTLQPPKEEWPSLGPPSPAPAPPAPPAPPAHNLPRIIPDEEVTPPANDVQAVEDGVPGAPASLEDCIPSDMDGLLRWCLLSFLKREGKSVELPLKTNLLYKNHLMPFCPEDRSLDVKKSSYKKMSVFLEAMQSEGLLEIRSLERGVDAVFAVNLAHPQLRVHAPARRRDVTPPRAYTPPAVREVFCVTAHVADLFTCKKGTPLTSQEIRLRLTDYINANKLKSPVQKGAVTLDPLLAKVLGKDEAETVKYDEVMLGIQNKMTASTHFVFSDGTERLTKTKLEPVTMQVATRSGNKKVTLVSNLEAFGFNLPALSSVCQRGVAAACGVTRSPAARADQLMLQGDQTYYVAKLLIEKYGLPKKFVEGADKAMKKKK